MSRRLRIAGPILPTLVILAVLAGVLGASLPAYSAGASMRAAKQALRPDDTAGDRAFPEFALTSQDGGDVTRSVFEDRLTIVAFIFTNCPFICPTMAQKLLYIQENLRDDDVRILAISVDPAHDSPETLREYAARIGADAARWTLAVGDFDEIVRISEQGLGLGLTPDNDPANTITLADGSTMANIAHTSRLTLVGPDGRVLGFYAGLDQDSVEDLLERLRRAQRAL